MAPAAQDSADDLQGCDLQGVQMTLLSGQCEAGGGKDTCVFPRATPGSSQALSVETSSCHLTGSSQVLSVETSSCHPTESSPVLSVETSFCHLTGSTLVLSLEMTSYHPTGSSQALSVEMTSCRQLHCS